MRTYEVLVILSPRMTEEEINSTISDLKGIAESTGATLATEEAWGRRRLAYPINKVQDGTYHLFVFESEQELAELDRRMKNMESVIRHMIVRTDLEQRRAVKLAKKR
ncbi:MAG: 30S ribosomal protein S6, partial [Thermoanaerobaculia bacterium]